MKTRVNLWAAIGLVLIPSVVLATSVIAETLEQAVHATPLIVRARVGQIAAQLDEGKGRINTYADLQVLEVIKGPKLASMLVKQPGGSVGNRNTRVAGVARFVSGEETVLFLEPAVDESGVWILRSLAAGKFDLQTSSTGEVRAVRHLEGLAFFRTGSGQPEVGQPEEDLGTSTQFLKRVRAALEGGR